MSFLSTPSARRATRKAVGVVPRDWYFYPRPPRGGRPKTVRPGGNTNEFLSTPSARRATRQCRPARSGKRISIHALREEGDPLQNGGPINRGDISIHALREEGDVSLPTISAWLTNFYPRPPRGGRRFPVGNQVDYTRISIHALREEGDSKNRDKISIFKQIVQHSARI